MAALNTLNILTNGDFSNNLVGWNVTDVAAINPPTVLPGGDVAFNGGDETVFGDAIDQSFATTIGNTYSVTLDVFEGDAADGDHDFQIDILDDTNTVVETLSITAFNDTFNTAGFTFVATSITSKIVITNTGATNSVLTDGKIDNARVIDITGADDLDGTTDDDLIFG